MVLSSQTRHCDFEDTILNGIKLRVRPLSGLESCFGKGVHQDISGAMQEETEVIGFEGVTGGAIERICDP